jgi:opacity protein-like surface antigen
MKTNLRLMVLIGFGMFASLRPGAAQDYWNRFYVKGDLGGNWTESTELKEFFGPVTPGSKVKFDPGVRFGVAAGFRVTDWFSAEAETGVMANNIRSITDADRVRAVFSNVPFMLNVRFQCPKDYCIQPYIGGGIGVSASVLDADRIELNGTRMDGAASDAVFAYQGFAGIRYRINERMGVSLEYHYFGATEPEFEADISFGTASDTARFGRTETHAVSVAFDYKF